MQILITGGNGLLMSYLLPLIEGEKDAPSIQELDITKPIILDKNYDFIIHAAAYTDVSRADKEEIEMANCYRVNVLGTRNLCKATGQIPFIYISTEYVIDPVNFYALTKLQGENEVKRYKKDYLILRTLFKPRPFEHLSAVTDQWTRGDYVDIIAKELAFAINLYIGGIIKDGILNIGTGRKSTYDLARQTRPDIEPIKRADIDVILPYDTSLDLSEWRKIKARFQ